jgi:hypothetical protein
MRTRNLAVAFSTLALATASFIASAADHVFSNPAAIAIPAGSVAGAYPSTIPVSGLGGNITKVTVTLNGFTSPSLYNTYILLTAPGGQRVMLINGDANGASSTSSAQWTFSATGNPLPEGVVSSGTYLPSNRYFEDNAPAPAPAGPHGTDLTTLNGAAAAQNGNWSLFVYNFGSPAYEIASGWSLTITDNAPTTTCASEGYTGTKLTWCKNICEMGYTGATLDMWIHRWINRYRDLPYCAQEGGGEEEPPPQGD